MAKRPTILFPEFAPDLSTIGTGVSQNIRNVLPRGDGYGPFKSLNEITQTLPAACRGAFFARNNDGSVSIFGATATNLYLLDNMDFSWTLVSKGGSAYSSVATDANWQFDQYNETVIAVQVNTAPQSYVLGSSTEFADLGGSPPAAAFIAVVNFFVVLTGLLSNPKRIQWSDLDGITTWTAGVGFSDYQDLPDGGSCNGLSGGDAYGVIFQDEAIRSLIYAPGSSSVFEIVRISTQETLFAKYSPINAGTDTFYISSQGFKRIRAGGLPEPIGKERVDRHFFDNVDLNSLRLVQGATDPNGTRVFWSYKSTSGQADLFDKLLCFDRSIGQNGRWTEIDVTGQFLSHLARPGVTLYQLDAVAPGALQVTDTADNGSGLIRLELNAISNSYFDLNGQNLIVVQGVVGTTEANGVWRFAIIDSTHIDLIENEDGTPSAYANAYVSGGAIGGSLDALGFSLDSFSVQALTQLGAVSSAAAFGFFDGATLEATMETDDADLGGVLGFVSAVRPLTDAPDAAVSLGGRMNAQAAVVYGAESTVNEQGDCPQTLESRYIRGRLRIPAGSTWTYARGLQPEVQPAGEI